MIEWLYTGQVKLAISQLDDALRLCKQCRLDEFEEEIQTAFTKADSFGKFAQCRNFRIFLSFRFYVKSILENLLRSPKTALFGIFGALNLLIWEISA